MTSYDRATSPSERTTAEQSRLGDDFMDRRAKAAKIMSFTMDLLLDGTPRDDARAILRTTYRASDLLDAAPSTADPKLSPAAAIVEHVYPKLTERRNTMGAMLKLVREDANDFTPYGDVSELDSWEDAA